MKNQIQAIFAAIVLTAQLGFAGAGDTLQVARTEKDARAGNTKGSVTFSRINDEQKLVQVDIDGISNQYLIDGGVCFGAVTKSGCSYQGIDNQDLFVGISNDSRCISNNEEETLTTITVSTLKLYAYSKRPGCRFSGLFMALPKAPVAK